MSTTEYTESIDAERMELPSVLSTPVAATLYRQYSEQSLNKTTVAVHVLDNTGGHSEEGSSAHVKKLLGTFPVYMTSCETMWGVIIFIKFDELLGQAGLYQIFAALALSMACQLLAASSLCAIATNGKFQSGGAYYMVVKSLGPAIGAAIGLLYFIGMSLLAAVEILGATEALHTAIEFSPGDDESILGAAYWDQVLFGLIFLLLLALVRCKDGHWVHHIGIFVMLVVVLVVIACVGGIFGTLNGWAKHEASPSPRLSRHNLDSNLHSSYTPGRSFGKTILTLIYPTFIGIFQGANKVSELKNAYRSIPRGAFLSILSSGVFYSTLFVLLAFVSPSETLRNPSEHLLINLAWPSRWFSVIGTVIIGLGSALSCIDVAPRILQSLAADGYIPLLRVFAKLEGKSQEPRRATAVTLLLCMPAMFVNDIETVATYTSLAFLCMYASMNFSCFVLSLLSLHSWRPRFRYYHWSSALAGLVLCLVIMFLMEPIAAAAMLFAFLLLICYVQLRGEKVTWGHGQQGIKYKLALSSLLALEETDRQNRGSAGAGAGAGAGASVRSSRRLSIALETDAVLVVDDEAKAHAPKREETEWRPQLLCYVKLNDKNNACAPYILDFTQQLKGSKGLNLVATIIETERYDQDGMTSSNTITSRTRYYNQMATDVRVARRALDQMMEERQMQGFTEVITASVENAERMMIQTLGLGKLRPNTMVVCWPKPRETEDETDQRADRFLRFLGCATAFEKAVVALKPGTELFPACDVVLKGTIDVWWVVHDGGLLLLLAHLLQVHQVWKKCRLRIFTAVDVTSESPVLIQRALAEYLHDVRIQAEVHVVDISKSDVAGFRNDWTLRARRYEQAQAAAAEREVADRQQGARAILLKRASVAVISQEADDEHKRIKDVFEHLSVVDDSATSATLPRQQDACGERNLAARHLKSAIYERSWQAQLVVLNLPVPSRHNWSFPASYLHMVDDMTHGLRRVLLVHGSGTEALSKFA